MATLELNRLASIRQEHGLRREEVAARAGVTLHTVARLERADAGKLLRFQAATLLRVAWALGVAIPDVWPALAAPPRGPGLIQEAQREAADRRRAVAQGRERAQTADGLADHLARHR